MESKTRSPPLLLQFILNKYLIYLLHCNIYISIYYVAIAQQRSRNWSLGDKAVAIFRIKVAFIDNTDN